MGEGVVTRRSLVKDLQSKGFTYKQSRAIVKAMIDAMTWAIKNGQLLELPFGELYILRRIPQRAYRLNKIVRLYSRAKVKFREADDGTATR